MNSNLSAFEEYLIAEGFGPETVYQHVKYAGRFLDWMADESLAVPQVTHAEMLDFADYLKKESSGINLINRMMLAVSYYFTWLQHERPRQGSGSFGQISHNPAVGIRLKGAIRNVPHDLLSKNELEALYESYIITDERTHRNKVIIGLLVYQALTREELQALRAEHLKLREGKIHIPQTGKLNSRVLDLQPHQILELQEYLTLIRPKILAERMAERPGRKPDKYKAVEDTKRLFITMNGQEGIKATMLHLNYALRKLNPKYKHGMQIRQSVITEWLKEKNLRTVQYMAGHRYVST